MRHKRRKIKWRKRTINDRKQSQNDTKEDPLERVIWVYPVHVG